MRRLLLFASVAAFILAGCRRAVAPPAADPAPAPIAELAGRVVDDDGPVSGATVRLQATAHATTTDADGRFRLPADVAAVHVTAWKEGYFIGFTAAPGADAARLAGPLEIRLKRLPAGDDSSYRWLDSGQDCARCHAEIYEEWSLSAHSRSATGKHFRDLYDGTDWSGKAGVGWGLRGENPERPGRLHVLPRPGRRRRRPGAVRPRRPERDGGSGRPVRLLPQDRRRGRR